VSSIIQLQAKTVFFPRTDGEWSFGAVASGARDTGAAHGRTAFQSFNVTGLASWYPRDELEIDLNLGVSYLYGSGSFAVAGAAVQYAPIDALQLLGEVFRDEPGRHWSRASRHCRCGMVRGLRDYGNRFDAAQWSQPPAFACRRRGVSLIRSCCAASLPALGRSIARSNDRHSKMRLAFSRPALMLSHGGRYRA
jgi:hypothetical protein